MNYLKLCAIFVLFAVIKAQSDGSFWWMNKNLLKTAAESRSIKDQSAKIRTLPPRYQKQNDTHAAILFTTTPINSIFASEESEENKLFKYDNEPDCVCTPKHLCNADNTINVDGVGLLDER